MSTISGVHLLPATGEFTYDTVAHRGATSLDALAGLNTFFAPGATKTDYSYAIDQLQAAHPECATVSVVCAWFADSLEAASCRVYPSTNYIGGSFQQWNGAAYVADAWRVSGLTQASNGLVPLPTLATGSAVYGGTPSDASVVRCLRDLKARGFKVVFYPFLLMTASGCPWRGLITHSPDLSAAATSAVTAFLGSVAPSEFTPDPVNLTVGYSGSPTDFTYRRMILHYAWLCTIAGGVNLFVLGSELRGLETIRGPSWTPAGTTDGSGCAAWDYPFVAGLQALAADVRTVFDGAGLTNNLSSFTNLISYSADWSDWMGYQHTGADGQWPHLDALWASPNIDLVCFDNYLPLSDWTTGDGGLDAANWQAPASSGAWPPSTAEMSGLGLAGAPTIYSLPYLKANIEGGEKFNWYYSDGNNDGPGRDPNGSDLMVSLPEGDRLAQARSPYFANQQLLANKQLRWWWNNPHQAIYDDGDGTGWSPHGPATEWKPQSKSICFLEYGFPACDKATNQPNVFFDPKSSGRRHPIGRSGSRRPAAAYCRSATTHRPASRWRPSTNIGTSMATTRPRLRALRWCNSRSHAPGTGMRGPFPPFRCSQANGATRATGRRAIGSMAAAPLCRRLRPRSPLRPRPIRASRRWRRSAGQRWCDRNLGRIVPITSLDARRGGRVTQPPTTTSS